METIITEDTGGDGFMVIEDDNVDKINEMMEKDGHIPGFGDSMIKKGTDITQKFSNPTLTSKGNMFAENDDRLNNLNDRALRASIVRFSLVSNHGGKGDKDMLVGENDAADSKIPIKDNKKSLCWQNIY